MKLSYNNVVDKLNLIFFNIDNKIKQDVEDAYHIKTRNNKLTYTDVLLHKFNYSIPSTTKEAITSSFNFKNDTTIDRTSFDYRDNQIPLSSYMCIYKQITSLYKQINNIDIKKDIVLATDGTFNNINSENKKDKLETALNMCYYDVTNDIPIELTIEGHKTKNNELAILKKYIQTKTIPLNSILVLDRAYCSYDFINYLMTTNYNFIIRFRNNCKNFNLIKENKKIRILKYCDVFETILPFNKYKDYVIKAAKKNIKKSLKTQKDESNIDIVVDKKDINKVAKKNKQKKQNNNDVVEPFKNANITMYYEYTLVTNLPIETHNDDKIKELYKQRWSVELFFKLLKYNFKFEHLKEHNGDKNYDKYKKLYLINMIIIYIAKIIEKVHLNNDVNLQQNLTKTKCKKNKTIKYVNKPNKSNIIKGVYEIIEPLFNSKLTVNVFKKLTKSYVIYNFIELGIYKERKAKTPFFKWPA